MMQKYIQSSLMLLAATICGGCELLSTTGGDQAVKVGQITSMIQAHGQLESGTRSFSSDKLDITLAIVSDTPAPGQGYVNLLPEEAPATQPSEKELTEVLKNGCKAKRTQLASSSYIRDEHSPEPTTKPAATTQPTTPKKTIPIYEPDFLVVHPDLRLQTQVSNSRLHRGQPVIFTITITNKSNKPLKDVDVSVKTNNQLCYLRHRTNWNILRWNRKINRQAKPNQDLYSIPGNLKPGESITFDTTYALKP